MDKKHLSDGHRPTIGDPHKIGNTTGTTQKDPAPKRILLNDPPRRFPGLQTKGILAIHGFARPHTIAIDGWIINVGRHLAMQECDWSGKGGTPREHVNSASARDIPVKFPNPALALGRSPAKITCVAMSMFANHASGNSSHARSCTFWVTVLLIVLKYPPPKEPNYTYAQKCIHVHAECIDMSDKYN